MIALIIIWMAPGFWGKEEKASDKQDTKRYLWFQRKKWKTEILSGCRASGVLNPVYETMLVRRTAK